MTRGKLKQRGSARSPLLVLTAPVDTLLVVGQVRGLEAFVSTPKGPPVSVWVQLTPDQRGVMAISHTQEGLAKLLGSAGPQQSPSETGPQRPQTLPSQRGPSAQRQPTSNRKTSSAARVFRNPYNFVPFVDPKADPPAGLSEADAKLASALLNSAPVGHGVAHAERLSGIIEATVELKSPMVLVDPNSRRTAPDGHSTFDVLTDASDRPYIPGSSFKGALRMSFECVTNSRLPRSDTHGGKVGYRGQARGALSNLVPALVRQREGGELDVRLFPTRGDPGRPGPVAAAWLPRYQRGRPGPQNALLYDTLPPGRGVKLPQHGDRVTAVVELHQHRRNFVYWRVRRIAYGDNVPMGVPALRHDEGVGLGTPVAANGWVSITNQNVGMKHDEKVFLDVGTVRYIVGGNEAPRLSAEWSDLIEDYRSCHTRDEIERRNDGRAKPWDYLGHEPGKTAWSPHQYQSSWLKLGEEDEDENAGAGTLCYAVVDNPHDPQRIDHFIPVVISRLLYPAPPLWLVPERFRAAERWEDFSPADRVFGWVHQSRDGSNGSEERADNTRPYAGHVFIEPLRLIPQDGHDAIARFDGEGLPLAVLAEPKVRQGRFYVGRPDGLAQDDGLRADGKGDRGPGFTPGKRLRGRKVYPHHHGAPGDYWAAPTQDRTGEPMPNAHQQPWYQEYRRPRGERERDSQNRSLTGWVTPGTRFKLRLRFENLSEVELGALTYSLTAEGGHHMRLGGGKPLGFGSATVSIDGGEIRTGAELKTYYQDLLAPSRHEEGAAIQPRLASCVAQFKRATELVYGQSPPHLGAFVQSGTGFADGKPIRYPRHQAPIDPKGENYQWFTANDKGGNLALADLPGDPGLPIQGGDDRGRIGREHR